MLRQAGHHVLAKTNSPIIGILTQPMPKEWYNDHQLKRSSGGYFNSYFESSHAEFLLAGGARAIAIDY